MKALTFLFFAFAVVLLCGALIFGEMLERGPFLPWLGVQAIGLVLYIIFNSRRTERRKR